MKIFLITLFAGFVAQMVDGTLGMAYGVSSSTLLRAMGIPSAMSSFCTHTAEIFTTLASGLSHLSMKNFERTLFRRLLIPGMAGGVLGAYVLTSVDDRILSPLISAYLIVMGFVIFLKVFSKKEKKPRKTGAWVIPLALAGGFSDSLGGGGWGPVVTSTLAAADHGIRETIGTVNVAEFFVTLAESAAFFVTIGSLAEYWPAVLGLIVGGVIAAPLAAWLCKRLPLKPLLASVGLLIIALITWKLVMTLR